MSGAESGAVDRVRPWGPLRQGLNGLTRERAGWGELASSPTLRAIVASRLVVWVAGLIALAIFGLNHEAVIVFDPNGASAPFHSAVANVLLAPAARWDSVWYLQIAHAGYFSQQSSGMFPLYPLLIRTGTSVFRSELLVGLTISLVSMTVALFLLERLVRLDFGDAAARTTVLLVAFFPVAFFLSSVYTEALYLLVSVAAVYAARRERWALAGVCGGLAAATRSDGILILAPLALMYLYGPRLRSRHEARSVWWKPRYPVQPSVAWLLLVPAGLAAYLAYLGIAHGQPFATYYAQKVYWGHQFAGPFGGVVHAISGVPEDVRRVVTGTAHSIGPGAAMSWNARHLIDLGFLAVPLVGLIGAWRRVPFAYLAYTILMLGFDLSFPDQKEPLESLSRYTLVIFPVFIGWALLLKRRPRVTRFTIGASAALLALFSGMWATWLWVA